MTEQPTRPSGHYFNLKGHRAEEALRQLAEATFLRDWCFPNPLLPTGKELCDLLVVFDKTAIIWQVKNLKLGCGGALKQSEVEKNLRQLSGARRQLIDLKTSITLTNSRRLPESFDPASIDEVFLISVLLGDSPDFQSMATKTKGHNCHVFTRDFTEIALNELDTIADFCAYLREIERIRERASSFVLGGGEKDLLAYYLLNSRTLAQFEGSSMVFVDAGLWDDLRNKPEYRNKKKADEISYLWDKIVDRAHTGDSPNYERIARELARPDRFDRRVLAQVLFDAHVMADENATPDGVFRRVVHTRHATMCFLFAGDDISREHRCALLETFCYVARGKYQQHDLVLGIATEMEIRREDSLDYCLLDIPEWGPAQQREMERLQRETGTLTNATECKVQFDEYPKR